MKDRYPVNLMEYVVENNLQEEPTFAWWVPFVEKKRKSIISKAKTKYWERTHKFGIEVPKSVRDVKRIDSENGNTL